MAYVPTSYMNEERFNAHQPEPPLPAYGAPMPGMVPLTREQLYAMETAPKSSLGINYEDGKSFTLQNPGMINLSQANPLLWAEIQKMQANQARFGQFAANYLDPARYGARRDEAMDRASTASMNRFAAAGLAGSSAAFGTANESERQIGMAWDDRQMSEQMRLMQMENMMTGDIMKGVMAGQAGYAAFQQDYMNAFNAAMQADQAAANSDAAMWGSIIQAVGTIGGAAVGGFFGGPAGAMAGGALGNTLGGAAKGAMGGGGGGGAYQETGMDYNPDNWVGESELGGSWLDTSAAYSYAPGYYG